MFNTPILIIAFNRPTLTKRVFETIKKIKPKKLYVVIDGPRSNVINDIKNIRKVNEIFSKIDWDCNLSLISRKKNLGCKYSVSSAIDWFFKNEENGIILEDDCLPHTDFFKYCEELLKLYKNNQKIFMITGDNFQDGIKRGEFSYYFSKLTHVWGWATWRRAWKHYDVEMSYWPKLKASKKYKKIFNNFWAKRHFTSIFDQVYRGNIDTWDYQWTACVWHNDALSVTPITNLVKNIGFGPDATHTKIHTKRSKNQSVKKILPLTHPKNIYREYLADEHIFINILGLYFFKILIRKFKSLIKLL